MPEYIERGALLEEINEKISNIAFTSPYQREIKAIVVGMERARDSVENAPAADVVPAVHGRWEIKTDNYDCEYAMCSVCGEEFYDANEDTIDITFNYCPNCGARMDGDIHESV